MVLYMNAATEALINSMYTVLLPIVIGIIVLTFLIWLVCHVFWNKIKSFLRRLLDI